MDLGETIYFLLHFTQDNIECYLREKYHPFQMYERFDTEHKLKVETCAITGMHGVCRPITLMH
jgi:hypothetical protein